MMVRTLAGSANFWDDMQRHSTGRMYLNFPGHGEGTNLVRDAFGVEAYGRLQKVKRKYDPQNPVPHEPEYSASLSVPIRSTRERFGFKAEQKVGESLTHDRFIFCSRCSMTIRAPLILGRPGVGCRGHKNSASSLKVCFQLLTEGKACQPIGHFMLTKRSGLRTEGGQIADCHIFMICSRKIWCPVCRLLLESGSVARV